MTDPIMAGGTAAPGQSLYDRLGGYNAIAATADDLTERLYVNATLNANPAIKDFHDKPEKEGFKFILSAWVTQFTGGPSAYFGRPMEEAHSHLSITKREFDIVMTECRTTFYKFNVPERELEELMGLLESYRGKIVTAPAATPPKHGVGPSADMTPAGPRTRSDRS